MPVFGMNLDAITILALVIALGMMVDNSVVISENFVRLKNEEGMSPSTRPLSLLAVMASHHLHRFHNSRRFYPDACHKGDDGPIHYVDPDCCVYFAYA